MKVAKDLERLLTPVASLKPDPRNARTHDARNLDAITASLEQFGQVKPIIVQRATGIVVCGNGTLEAAKRLGWQKIAAVHQDLTDAEAKALAIADNRTAELAAWDEQVLGTSLRELEQSGELAAEVTGFSREEIDELVSAALEDGSAEEGEPETELVDNLPEKPITQPGDVWEIGPHVLRCADSLADETWAANPIDGAVDMVFTDPPYGIFGSSSGTASDITDDKVMVPMFRALARRCAELVKPFGHVYVCTDFRSWGALTAAARGSLTLKNGITWDKGGGGLGTNYAMCTEWVAFFHRLPFERRTMQAGAQTGIRPVHKPNVWRFNRATGTERLHNAAKPIAMVQGAIEASSEPGEVVLDFFGGSGTTLIAAHLADRLAYLFEIEPGWCDVIVRRAESVGLTCTRRKASTAAAKKTEPKTKKKKKKA